MWFVWKKFCGLLGGGWGGWLVIRNGFGFGVGILCSLLGFILNINFKIKFFCEI